MDNKVSIISISRDLTYQLTSLIEIVSKCFSEIPKIKIYRICNLSIIPKDVKNHHIYKYHKYYITDNKNFFYFTLLFIKKKQSDKIISIPNDQSSIEFISYLTCQ